MSLGVNREAKWIKLVLQSCGEVGAVPTRMGSRQASWDSQSEEEGTAEEPSDPAAAELSPWRVGVQERGGREGGEEHSTGFFGPCQRQSRVKEKGGGRSQEGR